MSFAPPACRARYYIRRGEVGRVRLPFVPVDAPSTRYSLVGSTVASPSKRAWVYRPTPVQASILPSNTILMGRIIGRHDVVPYPGRPQGGLRYSSWRGGR